MLTSTIASSTATKGLDFGRFVIQSAARQLLVDNQPVRLGARAFDVLMALVERRDCVVSKNELLDIVWPGLIVEENNLQVHVSALRKLLGSQAIVTIPGRGYSFSSPEREPPDVGSVPPTGVTTSDYRGNLPAHLPPLIGRDAELSALAALLSSHRLITVTGAGGMGKTRLAQAAAFAAGRDFVNYPDGVWLIELAQARGSQLLLASLASTLGVAIDPDGTAAQLAVHLSDRKMLIVLDNCEHIAADIARAAATLLHTAPGIRLLATSQESLKLPEEHVMRLGALGLPAAEAQDEQKVELSDQNFGAVALFTTRAREAAPHFVLCRDNQAAVEDICRRLDGIPLAIEFAAARLPLLGVAGLRRRLDDRFRLLIASNRLAPARQQTLLAALEWSHALLASDEQIVFRRLGVFRGSFGLDAAQGVCAGEDFDEWTVLDHLAALIDKSLVISESGSVPRYRLLESARAFALARLKDANELSATTQRLSRSVLRQFDKAYSGRWTVSTNALLAATLPDVDNLRAALSWAAGEAGDATLLASLVGASGSFWKPANLTSEGLNWFRTATQRLTKITPADIEARLLLGFAIVSHQSEANKELAALHRAAELFLGLHDRPGHYETLCLLAQKQVWQRDLDAAEKTITAANAIYEMSWPPVMREGLLIARTYWLEVSGRSAEGEPLMVELVALMRSLDDDRKLDHALMQLAENYFIQGKASAAIAVRREVVQRIGARRVNYAASNLGNLSAALTFNDELDEALQIAQTAFPLMLHEASLHVYADHLALLTCKLQRYVDAARLLGRSDAHFSASGFEREESELRAARMTRGRLRQALPSGELNRLMAEGAVMTTESAFRAALGIDRGGAERGISSAERVA